MKIITLMSVDRLKCTNCHRKRPFDEGEMVRTQECHKSIFGTVKEKEYIAFWCKDCLQHIKDIEDGKPVVNYDDYIVRG